MKNISVLIRSEEESKDVQERLFSLGYYWFDTGRTLRVLNRNVMLGVFKNKICINIIFLPSEDHMTASEFLERYPAKTAKELFEEDTELVERTEYIRSNCGNGCNECSKRGLICLDCGDKLGYDFFLDFRQKYIDYANELKAKEDDPTEGGEYTLLDTSNPDVCEAWNESQKKNGIVQWVDFNKGGKKRASVYALTNEPEYHDFYVPSDCITDDGMPTGRALIGLWCRVWGDVYERNQGRAIQVFMKPTEYKPENDIDKYIVELNDDCLEVSWMYKYAKYIPQKLAKQITGDV